MTKEKLLDLRYWAAAGTANIELVKEEVCKMSRYLVDIGLPGQLDIGLAGLKSVMEYCDRKLKRLRRKEKDVKR